MYTVIHGLDVIMEFIKQSERHSSTTVALEQQLPTVLKGSADCTHCSLLSWEQIAESPQGTWESRGLYLHTRRWRVSSDAQMTETSAQGLQEAEADLE